ncbi:hypothetical protein KUTeg_010372 [Tegillarca granosa]|uniref:Uncharacterized protein n=1 Tax=Tegillarca granosa TaxID=220873 RepID=A0ABQ9F6J3_TEGGR|nr:hypothetical protein KUTeg_010372 [Tegillarca granosa]
MAVDCQRIQDTFTYLWSIMSVPVQTAIGIFLLWQIVGPSCLAGLVVLILLVPINSYVAVKQRQLQGEVMRWKGARTKLMNEVLNGIKVLKMYAWELPFQDKILALRRHELKKLIKIAFLQGFSTFCWLLAPFIVTLATFATFLLMSKSHFFTAKKAFVALALFNILRLPINLLSQTISVAVQVKFAIETERGTFTWERSITQATLREINLKIPEGHLVAVVGQVGSGKSSLISAMLGEMQKLQGKVTLKGTVAYVPQSAWIQNATLMDNILFGKTFLHKKYKKVLEACALGPDLDILPGRDLIEIGEKTRVLVTHGVHWLPMVDTIVVMVNGRISEIGSYEDLMSHDGPFAQFLKTYLTMDVRSEINDQEFF